MFRMPKNLMGALQRATMTRMELSEKRKGEWFIFFAVFLGGFYPVIGALSFAHVPSLVSLSWSTLFSVAFFGFVIACRGTWRECNNALLWKYALLIALYIGVLTHGLYFVGLEKTTPGNAAIINLFEVFTSFLFFNAWRKEKISFEYIVGALLMITGALIVLGANFSGINRGDVIVLAAMFFAPIGNFYQQKARTLASSETVMFLRSILSAPVIFVLAYIFDQHVMPRDVYASLPFLLINGVVILGFSKILWIEGIHRMLVTKAAAFNSVAPFITLILAFVILNQSPTLSQFLSLVPLVFGTLLLTDQITLRK